jgi:ligand-binding SRPBCC domain-containing protein
MLMPEYISVLEIARPIAAVFDFLARPANLVHLAPAELHLQLIDGPQRLQLGALLHWKARRMGVSQSLLNEVTAFEENAVIEEQQRRGPFRQWVFVHRFEATAAGTRLTEQVNYEPPGGLLGLLVTANTIRRDLETLFAYRAQQLEKLLSG